MYILNPLMYIDLEDDNNLIITIPQKSPVLIEEDTEIILNILESFIQPSDITTVYNQVISKFPLSKRKFRKIVDDMINLNFIKTAKTDTINDEFEKKYSRQLNLFSNLESINEDESLEIQKKIMNSSILVIGVGGVGTYVCNSLVRMGVGNITIIDHDIIEDSNLSRQPLYYRDDIGKCKVNVAQENLQKINPSANINIFNKKIKNIYDLSSITSKVKPDIIVCCADKPRGEIQVIVDQVSQKNNIAWILGGPHGLDKIAIGPLFIPQKTKSYLDIFGFPKSNKYINNINNNMISAVIDPFNGIAGLLISTEVIKYLTSYQEPCIKDSCIIFNTMNWSTNKYEL